MLVRFVCLLYCIVPIVHVLRFYRIMCAHEPKTDVYEIGISILLCRRSRHSLQWKLTSRAVGNLCWHIGEGRAFWIARTFVSPNSSYVRREEKLRSSGELLLAFGASLQQNRGSYAKWKETARQVLQNCVLWHGKIYM